MFGTAARLSSSIQSVVTKPRPLIPRAIKPNASQITLDPAIWHIPNVSKGLALAVSGGVDSMALAYLCLRQAPEYVRKNMLALVVDHRLRPESHEQALLTRDILQNRLGIPTALLRATDADVEELSAATGLETSARAIRYRTLAKACRERFIANIFFAHHSDDAYETSILRLAGGSKFRLGLDPTYASDIPENFGEYGIHRSGEPHDFLRDDGEASYKGVRGCEDGGIKVSRPLLGYRKGDLIRLCESYGIPWVEDPSNTDVRLTSRNAIRHTFQDNLLPAVLRRDSLLTLTAKVDQRYFQYKDAALALFSQFNVRFDAAIGTLYIRTPFCMEDLEGMAQGLDPWVLAAFFIQHVSQIVSPDEHISLVSASRLVYNMFPTEGSEFPDAGTADKEQYTLGHILVKRLSPQTWVKNIVKWGGQRPVLHGVRKMSGLKPATNMERMSFDTTSPLHSYWVFFRTPPARWILNKPISHGLLAVIPPETSTVDNPYFYDKRFWIGVRNPSPYTLEVRPISEKDRADLKRASKNKSLTLLMDPIPPSEHQIYTTEDIRNYPGEVDRILSDLHRLEIQDMQRIKDQHVKHIVPSFWETKGVLGADFSTMISNATPVIALSRGATGSDIEPGRVLAFPTLGVRVLPGIFEPEPYPRVAYPWRSWIGGLKWVARYKHVKWGKHRPFYDKDMGILIAGAGQWRYNDSCTINLDVAR